MPTVLPTLIRNLIAQGQDTVYFYHQPFIELVYPDWANDGLF